MIEAVFGVRTGLNAVSCLDLTARCGLVVPRVGVERRILAALIWALRAATEAFMRLSAVSRFE